MNSLSYSQNQKSNQQYPINPYDLFTLRPTRCAARDQTVDTLKSQTKTSIVPVPTSSFIPRKRLCGRILHLCSHWHQSCCSGPDLLQCPPMSALLQTVVCNAFFPFSSSSHQLLHHCLFSQQHHTTVTKADLPHVYWALITPTAVAYGSMRKHYAALF